MRTINCMVCGRECEVNHNMAKTCGPICSKERERRKPRKNTYSDSHAKSFAAYIHRHKQ
jgi:hypothetical protein